MESGEQLILELLVEMKDGRLGGEGRERKGDRYPEKALVVGEAFS